MLAEDRLLKVCALVVFLWVGACLAPGLEPAAAAENAAEASKAADTPKESGDSEKNKEGDKKPEEGNYIHLKPIVLPVIGQDGAEQIVTLAVDLQIKTVALAGEMQTKMPHLQDTILRALYSGFSDGSLRDGDRVDIEKIKTRLLEALNKDQGEGAVQDVLIQGLAQRLF